jgi:hypothetical protein
MNSCRCNPNPAYLERSSRGYRLRIADIGIAVSAADADIKVEVDLELRRFCVSEEASDVSIKASWLDLSGYDCGTMIFDSGGSWQLFTNGESRFVRCVAPAKGATPYQIARFDREFRSGEVYLHRPFFDPNRAVNPLQYPLDEVMMLQILARGKGTEIHSCGLVDASGNGYVFAGQSGAGKTTMARIWSREANVTILSDDRIILRKLEGQYWMYGTPWHGEAEFAEPRRAPLRQLFLINHGSENSLRPIAGADAAAQLFARTFPTFHDRSGLEFTLAFYHDLAASIPCGELSVVPDSRVVDFVRSQAV